MKRSKNKKHIKNKTSRRRSHSRSIRKQKRSTRKLVKKNTKRVKQKAGGPGNNNNTPYELEEKNDLYLGIPIRSIVNKCEFTMYPKDRMPYKFVSGGCNKKLQLFTKKAKNLTNNKKIKYSFIFEKGYVNVFIGEKLILEKIIIQHYKNSPGYRNEKDKNHKYINPEKVIDRYENKLYNDKVNFSETYKAYRHPNKNLKLAQLWDIHKGDVEKICNHIEFLANSMFYHMEKYDETYIRDETYIYLSIPKIISEINKKEKSDSTPNNNIEADIQNGKSVYNLLSGTRKNRFDTLFWICSIDKAPEYMSKCLGISTQGLVDFKAYIDKENKNENKNESKNNTIGNTIEL